MALIVDKCLPWRLSVRRSENTSHLLDHVVDHLCRQARIHADKESASHNSVGPLPCPVHAMFDFDESRLTQNVAADYQPGFDVCCFELLDHRSAPVASRARVSK